MQSYAPINTTECGWSKLLSPAPSYPELSGSQQADWVVIGGGYTGLSAAHRLAELRPEDKVVLLDAEDIGLGASARNSGFVVDSTLNDGQAGHAAQSEYLRKYNLNRAGIQRLKAQVERYQIKCDWQESGKTHCAVGRQHFSKLATFDRFLDKLGIAHQLLDRAQLKQRLGIDYYGKAVYTEGGVLINPAGLVSGLATALTSRENHIHLYSNSAVLGITGGDIKTVRCARGEVKAPKVIVAVNALMPRLGVAKHRTFPLTLSGGLTRPLNKQEYDAIGRPAPWGVLSVHPMGATVRLTPGRRILLRNTVASRKAMRLSSRELSHNRERCLSSIKRRFPMLPNIELAHYWAGVVCISRNSKPVFERNSEGLFVAGCYNAGGIAMGSLFGQLIVDYALGGESEQLQQVLEMPKANRLPPKIVAQPGLRASLAWRRLGGRGES